MKLIRNIFLLFLILNLIIVNNCQQAGSSGGGSGGGGGDEEPPVQLPVRMFAAGKSHTVALFNNGKVKCWGGNQFGRLGYGDIESRGDEPGEMGSNLPAVDLGTGRTAIQVAAGGYHTVVLLDNGTVKCWGSNQFGQLGYGDEVYRGDEPGEMGDNLQTIDLGTGRTAVQIAAGLQHTVVLLDNGTVKCWGYNGYGQLGYGDTDDRGDESGEMGNNLQAVNLGTASPVLQIAAGDEHTAVLFNDGTVKCWGRNNYGQLGYSDTENRGDEAGEMGINLDTVDLGDSRTAIQIACGGYFMIALLDNGTVKCWGRNTYGQLGYGDILGRGDGPGDEMGDNLPAVDLGMGGTGLIIVQISANNNRSMVLFDNGTVKCWGDNIGGELGYEDTEARGDEPGEMGINLLPVDLGSGIRAREIFSGGDHSVVLLEFGSVKCWGSNGSGQLGYGDTEERGNEPGEMGDNLPFVSLW